ncbi:MAG TPA: hypothetical protein VNZ57_15300 [Longimicrobiales bacterium]|nr:hypothetical protein [Longimicrobiales bacterium]
MRRFVDGQGRPWDIVLGRESWGNWYALFVPVEGNPEGGIRQTLLRAPSHEAAQIELDSLSDSAIQELLRNSVPKENT